MIPLRDDQPTRNFPIVTLILIAVNVLVFLNQTLHPSITASYAMVPYEVTHNVDRVGLAHVGADPFGNGGETIAYGVSPHPLWLSILTSMFLHGDLLHIGGNMLYLWIFGNNVEDVLGKVRFVFFYLVCGLIAGLAQIAVDPNSIIPTLGASGAIAGVLGAYLILYPGARVLTYIPVFLVVFLEIRAFWVLGFWGIMNLFEGLHGVGMGATGGIAYFAHIGGFFAGMLLILMMGGQKLLQPRKKRRYYYPPPSGYGPFG